jgi:hypothetical protein
MASHLTVLVAREWAGVDSVREQEKLEARKNSKMLQNRTRLVHLGMMAGDHFPPKNGLPVIRRASENWRFLHFLGDVLGTLC